MLRLAVLTLILASAGVALGQDVTRSALTLDDDVWVTFYDVPSRRFRSIRDAFVRGDHAVVARDLEISIGFLRIEGERMPRELVTVLGETIDTLESIRDRQAAGAVTVAQLDTAFGRAHWILAQHFLVLAVTARDQERHKMAGRYLVATAHHLERAVLWSNVAIDREILKSLESVRDLASRLQSAEDPSSIYRERPIRLAGATLTRIGAQINRTVRIDEYLPQ